MKWAKFYRLSRLGLCRRFAGSPKRQALPAAGKPQMLRQYQTIQARRAEPMDRKVKLSIRIKIIAVVSALVLVSLGLYLFVALRLFNDDKTAYVFQATSETATSIRTQAETYVARLLKDSLNI
jgi:hypothetical protein